MQKRNSPYISRWRVHESGYQVVEDLKVWAEGTKNFGYDFHPVLLQYDGFLPSTEQFPEHKDWNSYREGPYIVPKLSGDKFREYRPMEDRTIHRKFAGINSLEKMAEFANEFGQLGACARQGYLSEGEEIVGAEPFDFWASHIIHVNTLLMFWEAANDETEAKDSYADWVEEILNKCAIELRYADSETVAMEISRNEFNLEMGKYFASNANFKKSKPEIRSSFRYSEFIRIILEEEMNRILPIVVSPGITMGLEKGLHLYPKNLLGAIYAVMAEELIGMNRVMRTCPGCGRYFHRADIRTSTCSNKCRQRVYRERKKNNV